MYARKSECICFRICSKPNIFHTILPIWKGTSPDTLFPLQRRYQLSYFYLLSYIPSFTRIILYQVLWLNYTFLYFSWIGRKRKWFCLNIISNQPKISTPKHIDIVISTIPPPYTPDTPLHWQITYTRLSHSPCNRPVNSILSCKSYGTLLFCIKPVSVHSDPQIGGVFVFTGSV